jgi:dTDP-4-amino-4,6-dideoxygalactose transaminase
VGRVQIKNYPAQMAEIDRAMNAFWDLLEGVPGVRAHRPAKDSGTTKGGWYAAVGHYRPEELDGLSVRRFCEALAAEGFPTRPGVNRPLHLHPLFNSDDVYGDGKPTRLAHLPEGVDIRQPAGSLPVTEAVPQRVFTVPWFKHDRPEVIREYAEAVRKVVARHEELIADDPGNLPASGGWATSRLPGR